MRLVFRLIPLFLIVSLVSAQSGPAEDQAGPTIEQRRQVAEPVQPESPPESPDATGEPEQTPAVPDIQHALDFYDLALAEAKNDPVSAHARFAEAAAAFDAIEHVRPVGAEFHRAQGNAHFFSGDIGRAVLAYRRGLELRPGDDRLAESLRVAREAVRTEATPSTQATLLNTLAHWRRFVSPVYVRAALVVSWCGLWAVLIVARFRRLRARSILIAVLGLIALITGAALGTDVWHRSDGSAVVVIAESPAYNGPSSAVYEQTFAAPLSPGVEAHAVESRLGWTRIRLRTGSETWIRTDTMSEVVPSS